MRVPASRADIFKDRSLSPVDKRVLMRFLQKAQQSFLGQQTGLVCHHPLTCLICQLSAQLADFCTGSEYTFSSRQLGLHDLRCCIPACAPGKRQGICGGAEGGGLGAAAEGRHHVCFGLHSQQPGGAWVDWAPSQRSGRHGCPCLLHGVRGQVHIKLFCVPSTTVGGAVLPRLRSR